MLSDGAAEVRGSGAGLFVKQNVRLQDQLKRIMNGTNKIQLLRESQS